MWPETHGAFTVRVRVKQPMQYGGPVDPQLIYFSDATDNSEWDLDSPGVLVPQ